MKSSLSWEWFEVGAPQRLCQWSGAPENIGFYEIGFMQLDFKPMYGGRASRQTLRTRLGQHYRNSHKKEIRKHRGELWYRYKSFVTILEAQVVEGLYLAAFDYPWNNRNEWMQHWAME